MKKWAQETEPSIMERFLSYGAEKAPHLFRRLGPTARAAFGEKLQGLLAEQQASMAASREAQPAAGIMPPQTDEELFERLIAMQQTLTPPPGAATMSPEGGFPMDLNAYPHLKAGMEKAAQAGLARNFLSQVGDWAGKRGGQTLGGAFGNLFEGVGSRLGALGGDVRRYYSANPAQGAGLGRYGRGAMEGRGKDAYLEALQQQQRRRLAGTAGAGAAGAAGLYGLGSALSPDPSIWEQLGLA